MVQRSNIPSIAARTAAAYLVVRSLRRARSYLHRIEESNRFAWTRAHIILFVVA